MLLRQLFESLLLEASRGGTQVLANPKLVAGVADQLRNDHTAPMKDRMSFKRMSDEQVTQWFVDKLDAVEEAGYQGVRFSRDGQFMNWLALNYANGSDVWEDLEDVFPQAMNDWVALKNRNLLDPKHVDIQRFKGVKVLANYMITHYAGTLERVRNAAKKAAQDKVWKASASSVKIVENEDYDIYVLHNRSAAVLFGKSCLYCTANELSRERYDMYSREYPLFGLVPKKLPKLRDQRAGPTEPATLVQKFQFDANSGQFMNYLNHRADPTMIKEAFPYLRDDIVKGLKAHASEIIHPEEELMPDGKPVEKKAYNIETTVAAMDRKFAEFFTNERRPPPPAPEAPPEGEAPPALPQA